MISVVFTCPSCSAQQRFSRDQMLAFLQGQGMLRREKNPDVDLIRALLPEAAGKMLCKRCGCPGLLVGDDWADEWSDETRCIACRCLIPQERLQLLPDAQLCAACQAKQEKGEFTSGDAEYCERCGGLMRLQKRAGRGLAGYQMVCSQCGAR